MPALGHLRHLRTHRSEPDPLSTMARSARKTQEQLSLPELDLFPLPTGLTPGGTGPFVGDPPPLAEPAVTVSPEPTLQIPVPKVARRRNPRPRMVLVTETMQPADEVRASEPAAVREDDAVPAGSDNAPIPAVVPALGPVIAPTVAEPCPPPTPPVEAPGAVAPPVPAELPSVSRLQRWTQAASLAAALAVIVAVVFGGQAFVETGKHQRDLMAAQQAALVLARDVKTAEINSRAVDLFLRYNELMQQVAAPAGKGVKKEQRYWKEHLAVSLLESLFNLTRGNREWEQTVSWALERHGRFVREQRLGCAAYSEAFVRLLEKTFATRAPQLCRAAGAD